MKTLASNPAADERLPGRVLLVDDDEAVRVALARQITRAGNLVTQVASGAQALEVLAKDEVDVVLSDIRMPDMNGTKLLELARERAAHLPVVLMTGTPDLETARMAVRFGAFEYLSKPIDGSELLETLSRAVAECRERRANRRNSRRPDSDLPPSTPAAEDAGWTGRLLARRYRVGPLIGSGGMGAVYEAVREDLADMVVAVKVLHPAFGGRNDLVQRFRREAEIVAALEHPNIVKLLDFHTRPEGPTFLVMERLRGTTLAAALNSEGSFSESRVTFIASQLLAALSEAHKAGVIHRDLKPENVFLTAMSGLNDIVKVLDFGIAKLLGATGENKLTETGLVLGTPAYMAPEYARGGFIDHRADLYAVGCIMYECLSGRPPFAAENYNALLFAIQEQEPVPLRELRPDVAPGLLQVIDKSMARQADARFATAMAMSEALKPWLAMDSSFNREPTAEPPIGSAPTVLAAGLVEQERK